MNKRGQFFILGAVILAMALFVLMAKVNTYEEKILLEDFPDLANNYKTESINVLNDALLNGEDPTAKLYSFSDNYVQYARTINPNLGFVYAYKNPAGQVVVTNYNPNSIKVGENGIFSSDATSVNEVSLDINGINFKTTVPTKLTAFDKSYNQYITDSDQMVIDIGGIFYPLDLAKQPLQIISSAQDSVNSNYVKVDIT